MNQKGDNPMTVQRSIRLDKSTFDWLEKMAKEDRRSVSDIIRFILEYARENGWHPW